MPVFFPVDGTGIILVVGLLGITGTMAFKLKLAGPMFVWTLTTIFVVAAIAFNVGLRLVLALIVLQLLGIGFGVLAKGRTEGSVA